MEGEHEVMDAHLAHPSLHLLVLTQRVVESEVEQIIDGFHTRVQARGGDAQPGRHCSDRQSAETTRIQQPDRLAGDGLDVDRSRSAHRLAVIPIAHRAPPFTLCELC